MQTIFVARLEKSLGVMLQNVELGEQDVLDATNGKFRVF